MNQESNLLSELRERCDFYYKDLIAHTIWIAQNRYLLSVEDSKNNIGGMTPEDIAQEVIFKVLNGTRKTYDPNKGSVRTWLRQQVASIVDAIMKSATHRREEQLADDEVFSTAYADDPEDELIAKEYHAMISREVGRLLQVEDTQLKELVEVVVFNGCEPKPRFLAEALGTDTDDINNRLRRLRRLAKKEEFPNE